ncbi:MULTISPECIES: PhzF family phenazine biosynthesis protein [Paenibacillus]|uniref:PhzF family phenazine biosynthesis protein n=1 Tax=Paenibacillus TaxID=44249 RepID=UPI0022B92B6B|nr:PhzF family phenazine biosynthesis protein [Paenibacillus caseinilyticus]MCZ8523074.1 PhzF family phenazine biosynthesis protein [Paenibacillus caseinilyticus]
MSETLYKTTPAETLPELHIIDAFAEGPFRGNPAAVTLLRVRPEEQWLQQIAMEMNLSETAFLWKEEDGSFRLRWFTPAVEVDLCGHATLASAHYLWETGAADPAALLRFHTRSGLLTAERTAEGRISLDFPMESVSPLDLEEQGLTRQVEAMLGGVRPVEAATNGQYLLLEFDSEETVRSLNPDYAALGSLSFQGLLATARSSDDRYEFASRCFFPSFGINEDPVTGSAHCSLLPYWRNKLGRDRMTALQCSSRTGVLYLEAAGDRVRIAGEAVTMLRGRLAHAPRL